MRRRSLQRNDPIGALAGNPLTSIAALTVVGLALLGAVTTSPYVEHPVATVAAVSLFIVSAILLEARVARPHGPVGRGTAMFIMAVGLLAVLVGTFAVGDVQTPGTAWAGYPLSVLLLALVPYRPAREMVIFITVAAVVAAVVATVAAPAGVFGLVGYRQVSVVLSIIALPLGGVAYTYHVLGYLERARRGLIADAALDARRQESAITRAVQETRLTVLNREVVPFFAEIAAAKRIDPSDRERARALSESIRSIMVADIDRSWLAQFLAERRATADPDSRFQLRDPDGAAHRMDLDQRAAVRALIGSLELTSGDTGVACDLDIADRGRAVDAMLTARLGVPSRAAHSLLAPYLAVMGAVFSDVRFEIRADTLTLRFSI